MKFVPWLLCALATPAMAQGEVPATPEATPPAAPAPTADSPQVVPPEAQAQPSAAPPAEVDAAPVPVDERLGGLESRLTGIEEAHNETRGVTDALKKLKLSGYIQGRYEWIDGGHFGLSPDGTKTTETNRFYVRRGRLKATYAGTNAELVLQIDATGDGVTLKDAEATFVDTWTPANLRLTVGQFKWPFGYEVLQSSSEREMPERSRIVTTLFPGERDRGLRLQASWESLRFSAALVNGFPGTTEPFYKNGDPNTFKDVVGRVGGDFGWIVGGVSGYFGRWLKQPNAAKFIGADVDGDGQIVGNKELFAPFGGVYDSFWIYRVGADVQTYLDVPSVGGLALKGEVIWAKDRHRAGGATLENDRDPNKDVTYLGWYVTAVQNFADRFAAVARVDQFRKESTSNGASKTDDILTVGGGLLYHISNNLKATVVYEHPIELADTADIDNDIFRAQLQAKF